MHVKTLLLLTSPPLTLHHIPSTCFHLLLHWKQSGSCYWLSSRPQACFWVHWVKEVFLLKWHLPHTFDCHSKDKSRFCLHWLYRASSSRSPVRAPVSEMWLFCFLLCSLGASLQGDFRINGTKKQNTKQYQTNELFTFPCGSFSL